MVLPKYIETQWCGEGKAVLKFCKEVEQTKEDDAAAVSPTFGDITCYMSSLNIREYEERIRYDNAEGDNIADSSLTDQEETQSVDANTYICPPEVPPEVWRGWLIHWEAWKEIYIPLAWVQKHRDLCRPSYVEWHDSYISEYPWIVPFIGEGLDENVSSASSCQGEAESPEKVETGDEDEDAEGKEKMDRLYEAFSKSRYWVHLRRFLHEYHVQPSESLVQFFSEHGQVDYSKGFTKIDGHIPEFMRDNRAIVFDETNGSLQEKENTSAREMKGSDSVCNDEQSGIGVVNVLPDDEVDKDATTIKDEHHDDVIENSCDQLNQNNAEEIDKIGTKRRQQDIFEEGFSEDSEVEKTSALHSKRPRHNPLLEKNSSDTNATRIKGKNNKESDFDTSFSDQEDVALDSVKVDNKVSVDSDDKENSDLMSECTKNTKKSSKHKKKKKLPSSRHTGLAWVVKYFGKTDGDREETEDEKRDEEKEFSRMSPSEDNIFSVADSHGCIQKANCLSISQGTKDVSIGQIDGLSALANLPSADYQFRADKLNLKGDFSKLSQCFNVQDSSSSSSSDHDKEMESSLNPSSTAGCKGDVGDDDAASSRNCLKGNGKKKRDNKRNKKMGGSNGKGIIRGNDVDGDGTETVASKSISRTSFWFFPNAFPAVKNFFIMCASHLLTIIVPSVSGGTGFFSSGIQGRLPFFRKLLGFFRSKETPVKRKQKELCQKRLESWLQQASDSSVRPIGSDSFKEFYVQHEEREVQTVYQSLEMTTEDDGKSCIVVNTLDLQNFSHSEDTDWNIEKDWRRTHVTFDDDGNPTCELEYDGYYEDENESDAHQRERLVWRSMIANHRFISYKMNDEIPPPDLPEHLHKYWAQRHRLFLRYDEGIKLDEESWYSVTPEMIAAHHAYRCKCDVVVDAFCGSGGNAIQLASTCNHVIAIDIDPAKIELARHNAAVYGVEDRIEFIVGDFFQLAPLLKADVVFLSPPWGGTEYLHEKVYNVKNLGGAMDCEDILTSARSVTKNIAIFLPRSSDLCQVIELAGLDGSVDLEYNYMGKKKKALTAYFGDLVYY